MQHRSFAPRALDRRPLAHGDIFAHIGGCPTVNALVDGLYDRIETDATLRPLFSRHLAMERAGQKHFFTEWLGGPATYSDRAHLPLVHRHDLIPITPALAERWLAHFSATLDAVVPDHAARQSINAAVRELAIALVNDHDPPAPIRARSHGTCLRYRPAIESLAVARRGDAAELSKLLNRAPDMLASSPHAARLLHIAALGGRTAMVELLLDRGVDVDKPSPIEALVFVTPLCAARSRRRSETETLLRARGATDDVFTHAFVGDLERLHDDLVQDPASAQVVDPAVDALEVTPVHHAVAGDQLAALEVLLRCIPGPLINGARALRSAVTLLNVGMVRLLIGRGVDARSIGAGRWVVHPELAPLLSGAGARVDRSGAWIGLACTGNQGRKDDPELVESLLRHGARVDDRRLVGNGSDGGRATALHYASKAGFVKTIAVLLAHGADRTARDANGLTPLDWLERSTASVDRGAVRRLLVR